MPEDKKPENPRAFPYADELNGYTQDGMTLRDYFAGIALNAMLITDGTVHFENRARDSYEAADAMLKAREL